MNTATNPPTILSTGEISKRLGYTVSAPFIIEVLKVQPAEKIKAGYYWTEEGFRAICFGLATHTKRVHDGEFAPVREVKRRVKPDEQPAGDDPLFAGGEEEPDPLFG